MNPFTGQTAAIKVQDVGHECPTNRYERNFYPSLQGGTGMPTLWAAGVQGDYDYLGEPADVRVVHPWANPKYAPVIDLLGASLDSLYRRNGKNMDLQSTICIAMQVIQRLEFMHSRGILHRDIQLGNCVVGLGTDKGIIYMIDFGFSKRYIDPRTVPSRRDDMEALALMLIHVLTEGGLPWTRNGIPKTNKAHDVIIRKKLRTTPEDLCRGLPGVFEEFLRYCRRLKFFEQPDYRFWRERFADLAREKGYAIHGGYVDDYFVWPPQPETPPYRKRGQYVRDESEQEIGIETILEEIVKMHLEKQGPRFGDERRNARLKPTLPPARTPPEAPRLDPVSLPSEGSNLPRTENGNVEQAAPLQSDSQRSESKGKAKYPPGVIVISDSSDEGSIKPSRQMDRATKQATMRLLAKRARSATDNVSLADLLRKFLETYSLTGTRSRVITRDAFDFLDTLVQQLENLSSVACNSRKTDSQLSRATSNQTQFESKQERLRQRPPMHTQKSETVKALRQRLQNGPQAMGNQELAKILSDFCVGVRSTTGKTLTKDGVAVLEGIESRLRQ
ncbi:CK1/CK1 protein kinase [Sanghuangporus baumii]|uniref:CK1/CK1 protein kinase n=1 Tax=Sanghuangporus baumii TaxID=108892 RepID=A0A9Q5N426_SANBA|nr:CK1/CK1 protein kinase [Sanghuangporus baumii]